MVDNLAVTLLELLGREHPPQQIVIEASGVADPTRIAYYGAAHPGLRLDGLIVVADADTIRARVHDKYVGELVVRQLTEADLLIVSKTDLIDDTQQNEVRMFLHQLVPSARIAMSVLGDLPTACCSAFVNRKSRPTLGALQGVRLTEAIIPSVCNLPLRQPTTV